MGAAHSTEPRSVSMDNPTRVGVIDISDDVVKRLKKNINKQNKENTERAEAPTASAATASAATKAPLLPPQSKKETFSVPTKPASAPIAAPTVIYQNPPAAYIPSSGATLTAADVYRQKEVELKENDALWRQRMSNLEETLKKTNNIMESEYAAAVDNVRNRFATAAPTRQLPPCQDLKAQVIACYRAHPGETLKCAEEVTMFRNCISMHRIQKLDVEETPKVPVKAA